MKILFLTTLFMFSTSVSAQKAKMLVVQPGSESERTKKNFDVEYAEPVVRMLPDKAVRDALLQDVKQAQKWDELQKDVFYMELSKRSIPELKSRFPEFSEQELKFLQSKLIK